MPPRAHGEVVAAWLANSRERTTDEHFWAWEYLNDAPLDERWTLILALVGAAPDDDAIGCIGAGPLEVLVHDVGEILVRTGKDEWLQLIERASLRNVRLRQALAIAYADDEDPPELWERIDRVLGSSVAERHPLRPLTPEEASERERVLGRWRRFRDSGVIGLEGDAEDRPPVDG